MKFVLRLTSLPLVSIPTVLRPDEVECVHVSCLQPDVQIFIVRFEREDGITKADLLTRDEVVTASAIGETVDKGVYKLIVELAESVSKAFGPDSRGAQVGSTVITASGWHGARVFRECKEFNEFRESCEAHDISLNLVSIASEGSVSDEPTDSLTDRQREALISAVSRGHYENPRRTTAGELAAKLGVSQPSLSSLLRRSKRELITSPLGIQVRMQPSMQWACPRSEPPLGHVPTRPVRFPVDERDGRLAAVRWTIHMASHLYPQNPCLTVYAESAVYRGPDDVRIGEEPESELQQPTDAIIRVTYTAVCGSDLWFYRGHEKHEEGSGVGRELMGIIEEVGENAMSVQPGNRVPVPFAYSCGGCEFCRKGIHIACVDGGLSGLHGDEAGGAQVEKVHIPHTDGTVIRVPKRYTDDEETLKLLFLLTDVMLTGHHVVVLADFGAGDTVVVIGDGVIGLCGILAAKRIGAEQIIAVGYHGNRLEVARELDVTDTVSSCGQEIVEEVLGLTRDSANHVLEYVGAASALETAAQVTCPGGSIDAVDAPYVESADFLQPIFHKNLSSSAGSVPVRNHVEELVNDVLQGTLSPSPILTETVDLDGVPEGYQAMDDREAIKAMVRTDE